MVTAGIISVVIGDHFGGGDHFDGGDHFGGGTEPRLARNYRMFCRNLCKKNQNSSIRNKLIKCSIGELLVSLISYSPKNLLSMSKTLTCIQRRCIDPNIIKIPTVGTQAVSKSSEHENNRAKH